MRSSNQPTCYKNPDNPTCTDLLLNNVSRSFQSTFILKTEPSNFHLMTLTVMRKKVEHDTSMIHLFNIVLRKL